MGSAQAEHDGLPQRMIDFPDPLVEHRRMAPRSSWQGTLVLLAWASALLPGAGGEAGLEPLTADSTAPHVWQRWTREHGLPDNSILRIQQTRDGYLWVATPAGLARFDGRHWEVFNRANTPGLLAERFQDLVEDEEGNLWVGFRGGLFRWTGRTFVRELLRQPGEWIGTVAPSASSGIWCLAEPGLWRLRPDGRSVLPMSEALAEDRLGAIEFHCARETADSLWIGDSRGLIRFDLATARFPPAEESHPRPFHSVHAVEEDASGALWVLHCSGDPFTGWLSPLDSGRWRTNRTMRVYNGSRSLFLFRDREGALWMPNSMGSVSRVHAGRRLDLALPAPAARDFALAIAEDRDGGLWIGTEDSGLFHGRKPKVKVPAGNQGLPNGPAWTICESRDGSLWVGTDDGVRRLREGRATHFTQADGLSRNEVRSIVEDAHGRIWIGTTSGLNWVEAGQLRQHRFPGEWFNTKIRVLLPTRDGNLWVGTAKGLHRLQLMSPPGGQEDQTGVLDARPPFHVAASYGVTNGLLTWDVRAVFEDRSGVLWVGTWGGGLHRLVEGEGSFEPITGPLSNHSVWAIHEDDTGALWLATDRGLARLKSGSLHFFSGREGLPEDTVNHILEDGFSRLWLGGERGIYRYGRQELDDVAEGRAPAAWGVIYDEDEGVPSRETNGQKNQPGALRSRDGRLWFPTTKGVAGFNPAELPDQTNPPPVVIERIRASGESILDNKPGAPVGSEDAPRAAATAAPEFELRAGGGRILEIHYTAVAFVAADQLRFKYRLEGLERNWTEAGTRRQAQYANLKPGSYRFQVLAGNKYGVWNETGASFRFSLAPFFWQTWWFGTLCVAAPVLAGVGAYRWRLRQHRRLADAERRAALASERAEIARDLHDHLGARVTLMQHLSESLDGSAPSGINAGTVRQRLAHLAGELNASLDGAVWAVQPDKDNLVSLADYLGDTFQELLTGTGIELELEFPEKLPDWLLSRVERYHLASVAIEALNNVLKHAHARTVRLRLEVTESAFKLVIADNGCGFVFEDAKPEPSGCKTADGRHGLANMRQRIALLGGRFELSSSPGQGTIIAITLSPSALRVAGEPPGRKKKSGP
jgi:ligand-binding sensor domain-containing protein/signal transduction histidine kinase